MLSISDLEICVFCVEYLSPWYLCHHLVKISELHCCVNREEYLRVLSLCQMCRISQILKSVSYMLNISELKICVTCDNYSGAKCCVRLVEFLRY